VPFLDQAVTRALDDGENFELVEPLRHSDGYDIPAGYVSDFASVPRVASWLFPRTGRYLRPSIRHDRRLSHDLPAGLITSVEVDEEFRAMMEEVGVGRTRRWLIWTGVRWGAAFSPYRRAGWWSTAPAVLAISFLALPLAAVMALVGVGLAWFHVGEFVFDGRLPSRRSLST
jgi:hypothetical protein